MHILRFHLKMSAFAVAMAIWLLSNAAHAQRAAPPKLEADTRVVARFESPREAQIDLIDMVTARVPYAPYVDRIWHSVVEFDQMHLLHYNTVYDPYRAGMLEELARVEAELNATPYKPLSPTFTRYLALLYGRADAKKQAEVLFADEFVGLSAMQRINKARELAPKLQDNVNLAKELSLQFAVRYKLGPYDSAREVFPLQGPSANTLLHTEAFNTAGEVLHYQPYHHFYAGLPTSLAVPRKHVDAFTAQHLKGGRDITVLFEATHNPPNAQGRRTKGLTFWAQPQRISLYNFRGQPIADAAYTFGYPYAGDEIFATLRANATQQGVQPANLPSYFESLDEGTFRQFILPALRAGNPQAAVLNAKVFLNSKYGQARDLRQAIANFEQAANSADLASMLFIAQLYLREQADAPKAAQWLILVEELAPTLGISTESARTAVTLRKELEQTLPPEAWQQARAEAWRWWQNSAQQFCTLRLL